MTDATNLPSIYPTLRYSDAPAGIEFLTRAFQLTTSSVHEGPDGTVAHAELAWGNGIVMLGSRSSGGDERFDTGKAVIYLAVDDPDKHHAHAVAEGAEVVMDLVDQPYGSREYAALDPEGNVWAFGTYRPGPDGP